MSSFRWLHLSDFHIGKDNYGQIKLFQYILEHIEERKLQGCIPDAVFITGDIAHKGSEEQYTLFCEEFLLPLMEVYDNDLSKIYIIPGNHDLDRKQCKLAAQSLYDVLNGRQPDFFDATEEGLRRRKEIFNRFTFFKKFSEEKWCFPAKGIFEEKGYFQDSISRDGKKIGIIGLNTAWLCNSDEDREKLSPGKYILEEALNAAKDCDYKFVLGHHPLSWLHSEQRQQISTLLGKHKAMYLHGHMHKNSGEYALAYNTGFLTLQCGAAFQAREDEVYYNSLQWGELDFDDDSIRITPKRWSAFNQKFISDSSEKYPDVYKEPGTDSWVFPYSLPILSIKSKEKEQIKVPEGWHFIDRAFIQQRKKRPSDEEILKFFDGKEPSYSEAFSSLIPVREVVPRLKEEFVKCSAEDSIKCTLISGAGGEGKTTVFLQTIRMLVEEEGWNALVLRQTEKNMQLYERQILNFTREGNWIIAVDNCFPVAEELFELLRSVSAGKRQSVHFLLCARDTDWSNSGAKKLAWDSVSSYSTCRLRGIGEEDAERIVTAWQQMGDRGMGKLKNLSLNEAKEKLILCSRDEETKNEPDEGAFLGAMLATRYGDELQNHIRSMLLRLQAVSLAHTHEQETLLDAFAYIVAMHSEKLFFLSKTILARIYNYELKDVKKYILGPLGEEAASAVSGDIIYVRHFSIARAARKILEEAFQFDFDELYINLAVVAVQIKENGEFVESFAKWKFISEHFFSKNNTLAIRLDKKILNINESDPFMIVHLSKLYRKVGQPEMALPLFQNVNYTIDHRPFFCEWAIVEAHTGNRASSICLSAIALSDKADKKWIDASNACMNLYSITITFQELFYQYKNERYFWAARAAEKLGERIDKGDADIQKLIRTSQEKYKRAGLKEKKFDLMKCLLRGISDAYEQKETDFKEWIPKIQSLEYKQLLRLAGLS